MNTLHITLIKRWFDLTDSGEKTEEYRELTEYWQTRLMDYDIVSRNNSASYRNYQSFKQFDNVVATNGYGKHRPSWNRKWVSTHIGTGRPEWGAIPDKEYFVITLGRKITEPTK